MQAKEARAPTEVKMRIKLCLIELNAFKTHNYSWTKEHKDLKQAFYVKQNVNIAFYTNIQAVEDILPNKRVYWLRR